MGTVQRSSLSSPFQEESPHVPINPDIGLDDGRLGEPRRRAGAAPGSRTNPRPRSQHPAGTGSTRPWWSRWQATRLQRSGRSLSLSAWWSQRPGRSWFLPWSRPRTWSRTPPGSAARSRPGGHHSSHPAAARSATSSVTDGRGVSTVLVGYEKRTLRSTQRRPNSGPPSSPGRWFGSVGMQTIP